MFDAQSWAHEIPTSLNAHNSAELIVMCFSMKTGRKLIIIIIIVLILFSFFYENCRYGAPSTYQLNPSFSISSYLPITNNTFFLFLGKQLTYEFILHKFYVH